MPTGTSGSVLVVIVGPPSPVGTGPTLPTTAAHRHAGLPKAHGGSSRPEIFLAFPDACMARKSGHRRCRMDQQWAAAALEKHDRVQAVMEMWHFSHAVVTREFADEPGVIRLSNPGIGTRKYVTLSIPESVVLRVHLRLTQQALQSSLAARNPLRVIKLCNPHAAVAKQPVHITDLKSLQKPAHSARVSEPVRPAVGDTAA